MTEVRYIKDFSKMEQLDQWLKKLVFPGNTTDFIQELEGHSIPGKEVAKKICFYTKNYQYFITAIDRTKGEGYLGCQVNCRKSRPGEDWIRGNDLPDGKFTKVTWNLILKAIVSNELVKLSDYKRPSVGDINNGNDIREG